LTEKEALEVGGVELLGEGEEAGKVGLCGDLGESTTDLGKKIALEGGSKLEGGKLVSRAERVVEGDEAGVEGAAGLRNSSTGVGWAERVR
jgi:hypothetical protein